MPLPRIICDECMVDAEAEVVSIEDEAGYSSEVVLLRCHETEEVFRASVIPGYGAGPGSVGGPKALLWSDLARNFLSAEQLLLRERSAVESMIRHIAMIQLYHRVRRAQGAPATYFYVDEAIDTLFLFRNPADPGPPPPEPEVIEPANPNQAEERRFIDEREKKHRERLAARAASATKLKRKTDDGGAS